MELTNHQNRNRIEEQPTQWEDFKENHGTKMKFLFNIGITIGCIATMIYIFESNKSKYLLLLPIWILVMQVGYCCYALRKYIHADNIHVSVNANDAIYKRLNNMEEKINRIMNEVLNLPLTLTTNQNDDNIDSVSQMSQIEDTRMNPAPQQFLTRTTYTTCLTEKS